MSKSTPLIVKARKVAGEVSDTAMGAVKAVVRAAKSKLSPAKPKSRKRSATSKRPKLSKSRVSAKRRVRGSRQSARSNA